MTYPATFSLHNHVSGNSERTRGGVGAGIGADDVSSADPTFNLASTGKPGAAASPRPNPKQKEEYSPHVLQGS